MASPDKPALPETRERHCPACRNGGITPLAHFISSEGKVKVEHRCEACGLVFLVIRKPLT